MNKTVVSVTVVECEPPLAINLYEPIDFTRWKSIRQPLTIKG